jgi:hypothetical protein
MEHIYETNHFFGRLAHLDFASRSDTLSDDTDMIYWALLVASDFSAA